MAEAREQYGPREPLITAAVLWPLVWILQRVLLSAVFSYDAVSFTTVGREILMGAAYLFGPCTYFALIPVLRAQKRGENYSGALRIAQVTHYGLLVLSVAVGLILAGYCLYRLQTPGHRWALCGLISAFILPFLTLLGVSPALGRVFGVGAHVLIGSICRIVLLTLLPPLFGRMLSGRGEKAAALLRDQELVAVYTAAGFFFGILLALALSYLAERLLLQILIKDLKHRAYIQFSADSESLPQLIRLFVTRTLEYGFSFLSVGLPMILAYILLKRRVNYQIFGLQWGAFYSKVLPYILFGGLLSALPFLPYIQLLTRFVQSGANRRLRTLMGRMLRLSLFISLPISFFFISSAPILTALPLGNSNHAAQRMLQIGGIGVTLLMLLILLGAYGLHSARTRSVGFSLLVGGVVFVAMVHLLSAGQNSDVTGVAISLVAALGASVLLLIFALREDVLFANQWTGCLIRLLLSAIGAAVPVFLLSAAIEEHVGSWIGFFILFFLYAAAYLALAVFTGGADLRNLHRIPGGLFLLRIIDLFRSGLH